MKEYRVTVTDNGEIVFQTYVYAENEIDAISAVGISSKDYRDINVDLIDDFDNIYEQEDWNREVQEMEIEDFDYEDPFMKESYPEDEEEEE